MLWLGGLLCGVLCMAAGFALALLRPRLRRVSLRCTWCGRIAVSPTGQACGACLASIRDKRLTNGGAPAAPEDWPTVDAP